MSRYTWIRVVVFCSIFLVGMALVPSASFSMSFADDAEIIDEVTPATDTITLTESFEGTWLPSGWSEFSYYSCQDWYSYSVGKSSAHSASIYQRDLFDYSAGGLESRAYDTSQSTYVTFSCWFYDDDIDNGDVMVFFKNGAGSWIYICDLNVAAGSPDLYGWRYYEITTVNSDYLHDNFAVRYYAKSITEGERASIDLHTVIFDDPVERYAVLIGVGTYESSNEVSTWRSKLLSKGYPSGNIRTLTGSQATKTAVRNNINWLRDVADSNDKIVVTFNCHGWRDSGYDGHLVLYGEVFYYDDEFRDDIRSTDAASAFIFICACYSGTFLDEFSGYSNFYVVTAAPYNGFTFGLTGISFTYVTGTDPSDGTQYYLGAWTYFFMKYLDKLTLEDAFYNALYAGSNKGFRDWYDGVHWVFGIVEIDSVSSASPLPDAPSGTYQWIQEYWSWSSGGQPDGVYQSGIPQQLNSGSHTL